MLKAISTLQHNILAVMLEMLLFLSAGEWARSAGVSFLGQKIRSSAPAWLCRAF